MKKTLLLTLLLAVLLAPLTGAALAEREPRDVKYYFLVSVTDCSSDWPVRRSCTNSNGYIMMSTVRQDGSIGPSWSARVDYADWDHENATVWYYMGCEKGSATKPTQLDESCAIDGFPTMLWLRGPKNGENSYAYIKNMNSTYASTEKITLWVSSTGSSFVKVQSWTQTAFASLDEFDDDMIVDEENMPKPRWIRGISGPSTIPIPQLGHSDEKDRFYAELDDQYGNQWRAGTGAVYFELDEPHTGLSMSRSGVLTTSPEAASLDSGVTSFRALVTVRWLKDLLYPNNPASHPVGRYVNFEYPKYILMYYSEGTGVAIYEATYGSKWTHPDDIPAAKKSDDTYHYNLTGWGTPRTVTVTGNMNFTANYQAEEHDWVANGSNTYLICSKCRRSQRIKSKSLGDYLSGTGSASDPFLIQNASDWNAVVNYCREGGEMPQACFRLTSNISVSTAIGTADNPFTGTFDGAGHTLTVNLTASAGKKGPFAYAGGAAFERLRVAGTITTNVSDTGGLVGFATSDCTITDCVSAVQIVANGGNGHAGFVGSMSGNVAIAGSAYTGSIVGASTSYCAGFAGSGGGTVDDSVYGGLISGSSNNNTFLRMKDRAENCYYTNLDGIQRVKGKQAVAVTANEGATIDFGTPKASYPTSGITAYPTGLVYNGVFYAGEGETVALNLSTQAQVWEGYNNTFTAGSGTLTEANTGWTLIMPGEDVTISMLRTPTFATAPAVRLASDGGTDGYDTEDPDKLFDGRDDTKWCCAFDGSNWVEFHADTPVLPTAYAMTTAGDAANYFRRNPLSWRLLGKLNPGDSWTTLTEETINGRLPAENCVQFFFPLTASGAYQYFRLEITAVRSGNEMQIAEFKLIGTPKPITPDFTLPAFLTTVEAEAFEGIAASVVDVPASCTSIGDYAFRNCLNLTQIRIPAGCALGANVFEGCGTVYVFGTSGSSAEAYCQNHANCVFVEDAQD